MEPKLVHTNEKRVIVKWDFMKINEPNGLDAAQDENNKAKILDALDQGYEPFAVVPIMVRKSQFDQTAVPSAALYFKRPSFVEEKIDESEKIIT